jgi:hypothetical protein
MSTLAAWLGQALAASAEMKSLTAAMTSAGCSEYGM